MSIGADALLALDQGDPIACLRLWRQQLLAERSSVLRHLEAARQGLARDPIAHLRSGAIALAEALLSSQPDSQHQDQLGQLLRGWGAICLQESPQRAQQHLERAWTCGRDANLEAQLVALYEQQGLLDGALGLLDPDQTPASKPTTVALPWQEPACAALSCEPCMQQLIEASPHQASGSPPLLAFTHGRCWLQRHTNPWGETHGVGVADGQGRLIPQLCRRYPIAWPHCAHHKRHQDQALVHLEAVAATLPQAPLLKGAVLAVADLSAEIYYHWLLDLLPRLGWGWPQWDRAFPGLRLWHNGGNRDWVEESLRRLGIPPERCLSADQYPQLRAEQLLVPGFASPFGAPSPWSVAWLREFWHLPDAQPQPDRCLYLPRGAGVTRRPLLGEQQLIPALPDHGWQCMPAQLSVADQLRSLSSCRRVLAPHGAALAGAFALPSFSTLEEWVNPEYRPPYFHSLSQCRGVRHQRHRARSTPEPLQQWLYAGPLEFPIDPGRHPLALLT